MQTKLKTISLAALLLVCAIGCTKNNDTQQENSYPRLVCADKSYPFKSTKSGYVLKSFASNSEGFGIQLEQDGAILCSLVPEAPLGKWCQLHSDVNSNSQPAGTYDIYLNNDLTATCVVPSGTEAPKYSLDNSAFYFLWDSLWYLDPAYLFAYKSDSDIYFLGSWPGLFSDKYINIKGKKYLYWTIDNQYGIIGENPYFIVNNHLANGTVVQTSGMPVIDFSDDYLYSYDSSTYRESIVPFD